MVTIFQTNKSKQRGTHGYTISESLPVSYQSFAIPRINSSYVTDTSEKLINKT